MEEFAADFIDSKQRNSSSKVRPFLSLSLSVIVLSLLNFRVSRNYLGFCLDC
jgi:hypothetical protein